MGKINFKRKKKRKGIKKKKENRIKNKIENLKKKGRKGKERNGREKGRARGERGFLFSFLRFSLRFKKIGPYVFVGVKGKVGPLIKSYAWVPKS